MMRPERDLWTIFPVAALLGFAGWVALMVKTGDAAAVIVFVTIFLGATWRAVQRYHQLREEMAERERLAELGEWGPW